MPTDWATHINRLLPKCGPTGLGLLPQMTQEHGSYAVQMHLMQAAWAVHHAEGHRTLVDIANQAKRNLVLALVSSCCAHSAMRCVLHLVLMQQIAWETEHSDALLAVILQLHCACYDAASCATALLLDHAQHVLLFAEMWVPARARQPISMKSCVKLALT